ncbi:MAG: OmpH family outer membrane protein [Gammaproteobacteria bacterium]|nr:OmpH family outer membrane protein [Gammaproteobacteria bacterium]
MMKRIGITLILALMLAPGISLAEAKIGFVNIARLISESPQATAAMAALQEEFAPRQRELVAQRKAFEDRQAQVQRDLDVMGPEERRNAEVDLRKEERNLARTLEELNEDANLRRNEELGKLQRELLQEVAAYAQSAGYDLVVGEGVLYASQAVDITTEVLDRLRATAGATN